MIMKDYIDDATICFLFERRSQLFDELCEISYMTSDEEEMEKTIRNCLLELSYISEILEDLYINV